MALILVRVLLVVAVIANAVKAVQMPNYAAYLQNVRNPTYCLKVTGATLGVAQCDLEALEQTFDSRRYSNYALTPGVMKFNVNNMNMEIVGASTESGASIGIHPASLIGTLNNNYISANQKWQIVNGDWDGPHQLKNVNSGLCMTLEDGASSNVISSTQLNQSVSSNLIREPLITDLTRERIELFNRRSLVQRDCIGQASAPHQTWRVIHYPRFAPSEWTTMLKSVAVPTKCLENLSGGQVDLSICTPSAASQHWVFDPVSSGSTSIRIRNKESDKCLMINVPLCADTLNGAGVIASYCYDEWKSLLVDPITQSETTRRVGFQWGSSSGLALTQETQAIPTSHIWPFTLPALPSSQLFTYVTPPLSKKPFGASCLGPLECLSASCSLTCQKGGISKACQTKSDCTSASCSNGSCI